MATIAPHSIGAPSLSVNATHLLNFLHGEQVRWIVLNHVRMYGAAGLSDQEFWSAIEELEAVELVERAPYGPLLYIR